MPSPITRRRALKHLGLAGAGAAVTATPGSEAVAGIFRGQTTPITIAGQPVEIAIASVSAATVRWPSDGGQSRKM